MIGIDVLLLFVFFFSLYNLSLLFTLSTLSLLTLRLIESYAFYYGIIYGSNNIEEIERRNSRFSSLAKRDALL